MIKKTSLPKNNNIDFRLTTILLKIIFKKPRLNNHII